MRESFTKKRDGSSDENGSYEQREKGSAQAGRNSKEAPMDNIGSYGGRDVYSVKFNREGVIVRVSPLL